MVVVVGAGVFGCASWGAERARVESIAAGRVAAHELPCAVPDLTIYLDRDEGETREWIAGCNFKAIRVKCARARCDQVIERTWREQIEYEESQLRPN
jgi:hypothetical protein